MARPDRDDPPGDQLTLLRSRVRELEAALAEQARSIELLKESEEQNLSIIDLVTDGVATVDFKGVLTSVNEAFLRLSGFSREELVGKHFTRLPTLRLKDMPRYLKVFASLLTGKGGGVFEFPWARKDGTERIGEGHVAIMRKGGKVAGLLAVIRDVTERRREQEEREKLGDQLLQAQKMEAIGTLAGGVAHDINNVLAVILTLSTLIQEEVQVDDPIGRDIRDVVSAAKRGAALTNNLLGFARKSGLRKVAVSLNETVMDIERILRGTVPKGIAIETKLGEELASIEGDPSQMSQVLLNLCLNAVDAMGENGRLTISTRNRELGEDDVAVRPDLEPGRYVELAVADDGAGMDEMTIEHAFEPFFTTKELGKGTGLGLSMVYGIVKGHGGETAIESHVGQGTTVTVLLRASTSGETAEEIERPPRQALRGAGTVLLVDDEKMIRAAGKRVLERLGYDVILAENGKVALELFEDNRSTIDIVLLDIAMPVMNGAECAKALRRIDPGVQILLCSGFADGVDVNETERLVRKPFDFHDVAGILAESLGTAKT